MTFDDVRLLHGDCYDIIPTLPDSSIDLVVTDPPYMFDIDGKGIYAKRDYHKELEKLDSTCFVVEDFLDAVAPKMKVFYGYFFCNKTLLPDYLDYARKHGLKYDIFTLYKKNPIPSYSGHHLNDMEYCVMLKKPGGYFNRKCDFDDYRKSYSVKCEKRIHPAEKPVEFLERFVRVSCPDGGTVFDPFMGSGSSCIAAVKNEKKFVGIEKNDMYYELAENRIKDFFGIGGLFDGNWYAE